MAARRLLIAMLALLVVSSVAAALVPVAPREAADDPPASSAPPPERGSGKLVRRSIDADAARPAKLEIEVGDQLALTVTSSRPDEVEIASLGELRDVDPDAPARFDLLPFEPGAHAVRLVEADREIAALEVVAQADAESGRGDSPGSSEADSPGSSTSGSTDGARAAS